MKCKFIRPLLVAALLLCMQQALWATEPIHWAHGVWDNDGAPAGKLLSDNFDYWGESLLTGVEYHYESNPTNPPDRYRGTPDVFGRRLLDGRFGGDWHVPVGQNYAPLVVVFDFKRPCSFSEVDLYAVRAPRNSLTLEVADSLPTDRWREVYTKPFNEEGTNTFWRARLPAGSDGRYLRLTFKGGGGITWLDEVLVWGEGEVSEEYPEAIRPVTIPAPPPECHDSLPGIPSCRYTTGELAAWRESLGEKVQLPLLWATAATAQPTNAILPQVAAINAPLTLTVARNEIESRYLTLTNPGTSNITVRLKVINPAERGLAVELLGGGVLPVTRPKRKLESEELMRLYIDGALPPDAEPEGEMQVLPFFAAGQQLGRSLMRRHLANAAALVDFPVTTLPPGGSLVVMVRLTTADAVPGMRQVQLQAVAADGRNSEMSLAVEVVDVTLPQLDLWVRAWGPGTQQFPFESRSRFANDIAAVRALGATVWSGFPEAGTKTALFAKSGPTHHHLMVRPLKFVHLGHGGSITAAELTAADRDAIMSETIKMVAQARSLGLDYNQWFIELWDEPIEKNAQLYGELARIIKAADPKVNIYMNPLFWRPGFPPQEVIHDHLKEFYNEVVDISVPITDLVRDNLTTRELWSRPRLVNAHYLHPARRAGRGMSWKSFRHDFNGWGYYCYYAPRGNAWDISTWSGLGYAYQMVFPGPNGPIITPIYETMREGWEDYHLLAALRAAGREERLAELLAAAAQRNPDWQALRDAALNELTARE